MKPEFEEREQRLKTISADQQEWHTEINYFESTFNNVRSSDCMIWASFKKLFEYFLFLFIFYFLEQETVIELNCDLDTLFSTKSGIDTWTGHVDIITNLKIRRPSILATMTPWTGRKIVTQRRYGSAVTLLTDWIQTRKVTLTL